MSHIEPISKITESQGYSPHPSPPHTAVYLQIMMQEIESFGRELQAMQAEHKEDTRREKEAAGEHVPKEIKSF